MSTDDPPVDNSAPPDSLSSADERAIVRLSTEMAWLVDHARADEVHTLFTTDGALAMGATTMQGRDEIAQWGVGRAAVARTSRHLCTDHRPLATAPDRAHGTVQVVVYTDAERAAATAGDCPAVAVAVIVGEYDDRYRRVDGTWLFEQRRFTLLYDGSLTRSR